MKTRVLKNYGIYVLVAVLVGVFLAVKLQRNYYYYVFEYSRAIYSPNSVGNPNLITAGSVSRIDKESTKLFLSAVPGDIVRTQIYVRNGSNDASSIHVNFAQRDCTQSSCDGKKMIDPEWFVIEGLDVDGNVSLASEEVRFLDVVVNLPKDMEIGEYIGDLSVNSNKSVAVDMGEGVKVNVLTANRSPVSLNIDEVPTDVKYSVVLDDPRDLAIGSLLLDVRKYASILLGLFALYFIYLAYKKNK